MTQIERLHETAEGLVLDVCEHAGADCAHEEVVGAAGEVGRGVKRADSDVIPLSNNHIISIYPQNEKTRIRREYRFTAQNCASVACALRLSHASM